MGLRTMRFLLIFSLASCNSRFNSSPEGVEPWMTLPTTYISWRVLGASYRLLFSVYFKSLLSFPDKGGIPQYPYLGWQNSGITLLMWNLILSCHLIKGETDLDGYQFVRSRISIKSDYYRIRIFRRSVLLRISSSRPNIDLKVELSAMTLLICGYDFGEFRT